ncbi:hypothetical protein HGB07_01590, partial [Candidatus Roizmanbacteria bacterium]|nr:hypothetical protein [Candidatus Roizmanbacteria bacterium]
MKIARLYLNVSMLIALCLFAPPLFAQKASLSISPPRLELIAQPGKSLLIAYQLINNGDPGVFQTKVLPFSPRNELGQITIKPEMEGPIRFSLDNSEVQLDTPFFLKGEGSQQLLLRIRVPDGAPQGDYYYTLLAESQPSPGQEGVTAPQAKITIGTPILVTVTQTGELDLRGSIGIFDTLAPITLRLFGKTVRIFDSSDTVPVTLQINNQG